jgi:hypothetical protein
MLNVEAVKVEPKGCSLQFVIQYYKYKLLWYVYAKSELLLQCLLKCVMLNYLLHD